MRRELLRRSWRERRKLSDSSKWKSRSACLSVCLSVCLLSVCLSSCLPIYISVCVLVCLSVCLSVCVSKSGNSGKISTTVCDLSLQTCTYMLLCSLISDSSKCDLSASDILHTFLAASLHVCLSTFLPSSLPPYFLSFSVLPFSVRYCVRKSCRLSSWRSKGLSSK